MDAALQDSLADELAAVYHGSLPVTPLTQRHPGMRLEDAYAIQERQVERWLREGRRIRGRKVGLTSLAMQRQLGVDVPDYGVLLDTFFHPESSSVPASAFVQPRVEPELAFILGRDLPTSGVNVADVIHATDWVVPALEIIDSRVANWQIQYFDTIADNASSGGVVLGSRPRRISDVDLRLHGVNVRVNGVLSATGAGAAVLGSPLNAVVWLANTLGRRGVALERGQVILPGSVTTAIPVHAGDTVTASFAGMGCLSLHLA